MYQNKNKPFYADHGGLWSTLRVALFSVTSLDRFVALCLAVGAVGQSHAQTPPAAGSILQRIQKPQQPELPAKAKPLFVPPPVLQSLGQQTVIVKDFRFGGWVVRAYLPQQDVTGGTVIIQVVEAKFGAVRVEGATRIRKSDVTGIIETAQRPGAPLTRTAWTADFSSATTYLASPPRDGSRRAKRRRKPTCW